MKLEASTYADWFTGSLASPAYVVRQAENWGQPLASDGKDANSYQFFSVLFISAVIGATIGAVIPGRPPLRDRFTIAVIVVIVWYFISVLLHGFVSLFGGKGKLGTTVRAMMQLLALVYVVSNIGALLIVSAAGLSPTFEGLVTKAGLERPGDVIISIQFFLLLVYLPLTIRRAHGFPGVGAIGIVFGLLIGLVGALVSALLAAAVMAQGSC